MTSRLREIAEKNADLSDQGRDAQAGTPTSAPQGQGSGGTYKAVKPHVQPGGAKPIETSFVK